MQTLTPPTFRLNAFVCPFSKCRAYAEQIWTPLLFKNGSGATVPHWQVSRCSRCSELALWLDQTLIYPRTRIGPEPLAQTPAPVLAIYEEAREVAGISRKSAAGLLRLALQMLLDELEPGDAAINTKIAALVRRGLDENVQRAMDILRVVGNESVHPGQIDLDADDELLLGLFALINLIVEQVIVRREQVDSLFSRLPKAKVEAIERRDAPKALPPGEEA